MRPKKELFFFILLLLYFHSIAFSNDEINKITIYTQGIAHIFQKKAINFSSSPFEVNLTNIPGTAIPATILISLDGELIEKKVNNQRIDLKSVLMNSFNKEISLISFESGQQFNGKLIGFEDGKLALLKEDKKLVLIPSIEDFVISTVNFSEKELAANLGISFVAKPKNLGINNVSLSYLAKGFSWRANYYAVIDEKSGKLDIQCWADVSNTSGVDFRNVDLTLSYGDLQIIGGEVLRSRSQIFEQSTIEKLSLAESNVVPEGIFEFYSLKIPHKVTLMNEEMKSFLLFQANSVRYKKKFQLDFFDYNYSDYVKDRPWILISFENNEKNNLGYTLPSGMVNVFQKSQLFEEFIGQTNFNFTPKNESAEVNLGKASDLVVESKIEKTIDIPFNTKQKFLKVFVKNNKNESVELEYSITSSGDLELVNTNVKPFSQSSKKISFNLSVKPNSETTLEVEYKLTVNK